MLTNNQIRHPPGRRPVRLSGGRKKHIKTILPEAAHQVYPSRKGPTGSRDPLFKLNHICVKLRADLSRLARKTWSATKKAACLQDHLDLYVAFNNGYCLA